jgi:hypothetical protein
MLLSAGAHRLAQQKLLDQTASGPHPEIPIHGDRKFFNRIPYHDRKDLGL